MKKCSRGEKGNTVANCLQIQLVERLYDGPSRWRDENPSFRALKDFNDKTLGREIRVRDKMLVAWGKDSDQGARSVPRVHEFFKGTMSLNTCVNLDCPERSQRIGVRPYNIVALTIDYGPCKTCGQKCENFLFRPIENKWLYALKAYGEMVTLVHEMFVKDKGHWYIREHIGKYYRKERVFENDESNGTHHYAIEPDQVYKFFLSPVQLSRNALQVLMKLAGQGIGGDLPGKAFHGLAVEPDTGKKGPEIVPVSDTFAWCEDQGEWDYGAMLDAQYQLLTDPDEQVKLQIATVLNALIGDVKKDKFDLKDEIDAKAKHLSQAHAAKAWLDRYGEYRDLLAEEVKTACVALIDRLGSTEHRIIELSCQEELETPGFDFPLKSPLSLGILHYASVLKNILGCPVGQAHMAQLAKGKKNAESIPYKNILEPSPEDRKALETVRGELGDFALNLLAGFVPALIRSAQKYGEAKKVVEYIEKLGSKAEVTGDSSAHRPTGYQELRFLKVLAVPDKKLKEIGQKFLAERAYEHYHDIVQVLQGAGLSSYEGFVTLFSIWTGFKVYRDSSQPYEGLVPKVARAKMMVDYPIRVMGFALEQSKLALLHSASKRYGVDLSKLTSGQSSFLSRGSIGQKRIVRDLARFERNLKVYRYLEHSIEKAQYLAKGPAAIVFGGIDFVVQVDSTITAYENGNLGKAFGTGILATAAVVSLSAGLMTVFNVGALATGPLALLSLFLTLAGSILIKIFSKTDLEIFAAHCFLGDQYGRGSRDPGPSWAEREPVRSWSAGSDPRLRQLRYLLNLIGAFKVGVNFGIVKNARMPIVEWGALVKPGYFPPGAIAEVEVAGFYLDKYGEEVVLKSTAIINLMSGDYVLRGDEVKNPAIKVYGGPWGSDEFGYFSVSLPHKLENGVHMKVKIDKRSKRKINIRQFRVRVRFDIDGSGHYLSAGRQKYVTIHSKKSFLGQKIKTSLDA